MMAPRAWNNYKNDLNTSHTVVSSQLANELQLEQTNLVLSRISNFGHLTTAWWCHKNNILLNENINININLNKQNPNLFKTFSHTKSIKTIGEMTIWQLFEIINK